MLRIARRTMRPQTGHHPSRRGASAAPRDEGQAALLARGRSGRPQPPSPCRLSSRNAVNRTKSMTSAKSDVLGIGNASFDVLVQTDEGFLVRHGMAKGGMALIDEARAAAIYSDMGPATEMSGGSGANTIVGVASFGARAAFIGKVKNDQIGGLYTHDIRAAGVAYETKAADEIGRANV